MADSTAIDDVPTEPTAPPPRAKLPDGWWDGSAVGQRDYWRRRAETAEAQCRVLADELNALRGRVL